MTDLDISHLRDLAAKLEVATGPDRDLDGHFYIVTTPEVLAAGRIDHDRGVVGWWPKDRPYQSACDVPRYTDSITAAVGLVERMLPGWGWAIGRIWCDNLAERSATIWMRFSGRGASMIGAFRQEIKPGFVCV